MKVRQTIIELGIGVCMFGAVWLQAHAGPASCPQLEPVEAIVRTHLPGFVLATATEHDPDSCSKVVSADFNGDGSLDYAAVLTERGAPRTYSDGTAQFSAYVFVFLASRLPYAEYQAVLLLGHSSAPRRITLETVSADPKGRKAQLVVKNAAYSRSVYEWASTGFVVRDHAAD